MYAIISFIAETSACVYDNYREFELSILSLFHLKQKGRVQWSLIAVNVIGTGKKLTSSKPYW